ncbi:DUF4157 domain-containing protein [Ferruginibacter yonginensis]|uniref:DUF4157 domain-containing protein n=1 Tax=Ferruginibacter yonginensis TaxID=1310416 RepID=A0ABV8QT47_9BACT
MSKLHYRIKEKSWLAAIAAKKLNVTSVAMVLGSTIHLHGCTAAHFLKDERWVKHELCHVQQFKTHGFIPFLLKYLWESYKNGYYNNKYEVAARAAENC